MKKGLTFKEKFLIFKSPEAAAAGAGGGAERAGERAPDRRELAERLRHIEEETGRMRQELADMPAEQLTAEDLINDELDKIKTDKDLDSFIKRLPLITDSVNRAHIEQILDLCEKSPSKDKFFKKILVFTELKIIPVENLSEHSIGILVAHFEKSPKELRRLIGKLLKNTGTTDSVILACKDNANILDQIFDAIKDKRRLKQVSPQALAVLANHYQNNAEKLRAIFEAYCDNPYILGKLATALEGDLELTKKLYEHIRKKPVFKELRGEALAILLKDQPIATVRERGILSVEQKVSLLTTTFLDTQSVFEQLVRTTDFITINEKKSGLQGQLAAEALIQYSWGLGTESPKYKELVEKLNPERKKALISEKRLPHEIRQNLYDSMEKRFRAGFTMPEAAEQEVSMEVLAEELQKFLADQHIEGFWAKGNEEAGYVEIRLTDAIRSLPENLDLNKFPQFQVKPGDKIDRDLVDRLLKAKDDLIQYACLIDVPSGQEALASFTIQDEQIQGFDPHLFDSSVLDWEKNWDKISVSPQLAAVLSSSLFSSNPDGGKRAIARLLKEIVQEGSNAKISLEDILEASHVFEAVSVLPEYLEHHKLDREDPESFLEYFTWLGNRLKEESAKPNPNAERLEAYRQALGEMHRIYDASFQLIGLVANANLISETELGAVEKVRKAPKTAPKAVEPAAVAAAAAAAPSGGDEEAETPESPAAPGPPAPGEPPAEPAAPAPVPPAPPEAPAPPEPPAPTETATAVAIRNLTNTQKLEEATTAWDTVEAIYGKAVRTRKGNRAKRAEIWAEMGEEEPFKGRAEQNLKIRKYLKAKLKEVQASSAPAVEPVAPAVAAAPEPPAAPAAVAPAAPIVTAPGAPSAAPAVAPTPAPAPAPVIAESPAPAAPIVTAPGAPSAAPAVAPTPAPAPAPVIAEGPAPAAPVEAPVPASVAGAPEPEPESGPEPELTPEVLESLTSTGKAELLAQAATSPADKQKLFDSLLSKPEELNTLDTTNLHNLVSYAAENDENLGKLEQFLATEAAKPVIAKLSADSARILLEKASARKKEALVRHLSDNLAPEIVERLINDPALDEKILEALAPAVAKLIKKLKIERKDGKFRRKLEGKDTYYPGTYRFSLAEPAKVLYEDDRGVQSAVITDGELDWKWESRKEPSPAPAAAAETAENPNYINYSLDRPVGKFNGIDIPKTHKVTKVNDKTLLIKTGPLQYILLSLTDGSFDFYPSDEARAEQLETIRLTIDKKQTKTSLANTRERSFRKGEILKQISKKGGDLFSLMNQQINEERTARIEQKIAGLRSIASEVAAEQTEAISLLPRRLELKPTAQRLVYRIHLEGRETNYYIHIEPDRHSEVVRYAFYEGNNGPNYADPKPETVKRKFTEIFQKIPNEYPVKEPEKRIPEITNTTSYGTEIVMANGREIKELRVHQYRTIVETLKAIEETIKTGKDPISTVRKLEKLAREAARSLKTSPIQTIKINSKPRKISWNLTSGSLGDGETLMGIVAEIKAEELGKDSEEYKQFIASYATREAELITELTYEERLKQYEKTYRQLTEKTYKINWDSPWEGDIVENWETYLGYREVDNIMISYPFGLHKEQVRKHAAAIISECDNEEVEFGDIFKKMEGWPEIDNRDIPQKFLENSEAFLAEFKRIKNKKEPTELEQKRLEKMFTVLAKCLDLLEAFTKLKPKPKQQAAERREHARLLPDVQREQDTILAGLRKLADSQSRNPGFWEKFIVWASRNGQNTMTMSDIDGKTFRVSKGQFKDQFESASVFRTMTNIQDRYHFEDGIKVLDKTATLNEVNDIIRLGFINIFLAEQGKKDKKDKREIAEILKDPKFKEELEGYLIKDFGSISDKAIQAFQIGYAIKEARKFAEQIEEGTEALSRDNEIIASHPLFKQVSGELLRKGVRPELIKKVQEKLLFAAGATFKNGKFEGAGLGVPIDLGNGYTLLIRLGANRDGDLLVGVGLDINIYRGETVEASIVLDLGLTEVGAGSRQTFKTEYVNIHAFEGFRWSWDSIIPTIGGALGISWNMEKQLERDLEEAEAGTDYAKLWQEWKNIPRHEVDKKFEAIKKIPQIWRRIEPLMAESALTKQDVIHMIEGIQEQITSEVLENLSSPIPIFSYGGFGMVGFIPVPHVGIKMGSAKVSIPNRRAISKILNEISDIRTTTALKEAVEKIDKKEAEPIFREQTGNLVYGRDGQLLVLEKSDEINLQNWETGIDTYNEALKRVEMTLIPQLNGTIELNILNTADKDTEIHIDPTLKTLAVIKDGNRLFIEGNVDDLIITRERFSVPFAATGSSPMRDVITIRQRDSVRGNRDRTWIERFEGLFLQKLEKEHSFDIYPGNNRRQTQNNIFEARGYRNATPHELATLHKNVADFLEDRPKLKEKLDKKDLKSFEELIKGRRAALQGLEYGEQGLTARNYSEQEVRTETFMELNKLFSDKTFAEDLKEFSSIVDQPEKITQFVIKFSKKLGITDLDKTGHEKELNLAVIHLINGWFTNIYAERAKKKPDQKLTPREIREVNKKLLYGLKIRIKYVRDKVLIPEFKAAIERMEPKPSINADRIASLIIDNIYAPLIAKLNEPDFDFRTLEVEGIPAGAFLFSGSRAYEAGTRRGALAETVNYNTLPKAEALVHDFGFLEGTITPYKLDSTDQTERDIARVLLEVASPIPKDDLEFLRSPLALKIASLQSHVLLSYNDVNEPGDNPLKTAGKFEDHLLITEIYRNPEILKTSPAHKNALNRFRKLVEAIRESQIHGRTFEKRIGNTGLTVKITMPTEIVSGAYSKCTNASAYVIENGTIEILKAGKVLGTFTMTNEMIDPQLSKIFASFGVGVGFRSEKVTRPAAPTPPRGRAGGGSETGGGSGTSATGHGGVGQEVSTPQDTPAANAGE